MATKHDLAMSLADRFEGALKTARSTFQTGQTRPLEWRIAQFKALKAMLGEHERAFWSTLYRDLGKSHFEASYIELDNVRNSCDFFIKNLRKLIKPKSTDVPWYMRRSTGAKNVAEPLGIVLVFSAWNYPLLLALDPLVAAITAGNAVIVKPLECAKSMSAQAVQVLEATRQECAVLLRYKFDKIFCTTCPCIGRIIMEATAKHLTPVTLELRGKSPVIIDSTTDISTSTHRLAPTKWLLNCGQTCIAPDYILVHLDVTSSFLEALKEALIYTGYAPYLQQGVFGSLQTLLDEVKDSVAFSLGETDKENLVMMPNILLDPPVESRIMQEEIAEPILPVLQVQNMEEALNFVRSRPQPVAVYMFTTNMELANEVVEKTSSGSVVINDAGAQFSLQSIPFGGIGESGMGSYHGRYGFDTFSHLKGVVTTKANRDDPIHYPLYTAKNKAILRACLRN
ncbi:hypothetical protein KP509_13G027100 [Ceratopteris richardii]|uniref:Aldehyde dehydrogenase n=1 Tax=Ceratopteris richardii TaxID=49495 RepID=A0A8T2TGC2_CERRI|nr:hypothetical protein KP509_13G027100 [Ceratopteris richardii]